MNNFREQLKQPCKVEGDYYFKKVNKFFCNFNFKEHKVYTCESSVTPL